jgi:FdhD protein
MTLGAEPEWLVLGFLRNQRLIDSVDQIESITVDWTIGEGELGEPGVAAVKTRANAQVVVERSADRVVTTGCGQGSVFGDLMAHIDEIELPPAQITQSQLYGLVNAIRCKKPPTNRPARCTVAPCFRVKRCSCSSKMWGATTRWTPSPVGCGCTTCAQDKVFYTTGRLTSEMVIKSAQMGVPVVVSRSGITQMGLDVAQRLGLCAIGRATNKRFLCFSAPERLVWQCLSC